MKKSLLAMAMTLATGGAIAQSSVTLYGVIDQGFIKDTSSTTGPNNSGDIVTKENNSKKFSGGISTANRFGIKAQEDLGEGLTAKATIEFGFGEPSENQSTIHALRQAWVGIDSSEGHMIKVGRIQSQSFEILAETDASGSGSLAGSILSNRDTTLDSRQGVMYHFKQPTYGFGIGYFYTDEHKKTHNQPEAFTWINEDNIPITIQDEATHKHHYKRNTGYELSAHADDGFLFGKIVYAAGTFYDDFNLLKKYNPENPEFATDAKRTLLTTNVGLKLQPGTKISYTYQNHRLTNDNWSNGTIAIATNSKLRAEAHQINFNHMVTPQVEVFSSYSLGMMNINFMGTAKDFGYKNEVVSKIKGTGFQVGGRYHYSKRTNLYAMYGQESWKINVGDEDPIRLKSKQETFGVGLKHMF